MLLRIVPVKIHYPYEKTNPIEWSYQTVGAYLMFKSLADYPVLQHLWCEVPCHRAGDELRPPCGLQNSATIQKGIQIIADVVKFLVILVQMLVHEKQWKSFNKAKENSQRKYRKYFKYTFAYDNGR